MLAIGTLCGAAAFAYSQRKRVRVIGDVANAPREDRIMLHVLNEPILVKVSFSFIRSDSRVSRTVQDANGQWQQCRALLDTGNLGRTCER